MPENFEIRYRMSKASSIDAMIEVTNDLKKNLSEYFEGKKTWQPEETGANYSPLPLPPWLCQPYVRIPVDEHIRKLAEAQQKAYERRQQSSDQLGPKRKDSSNENATELSRKKRKKLQRNPNKKFSQPAEVYEKCACKNPRGSRCVYMLCRTCCKFKCHLENSECPGHRIRYKLQGREKGNISVISNEEVCSNIKEQVSEESTTKCVISTSHDVLQDKLSPSTDSSSSLGASL